MESRQPKSVYIRFLNMMVELLHEKAPKHCSWIEVFLGMFHDIMVYSAEEILAGAEQPDSNSEAYKIGIKVFFNNDMIQNLGHFILQEKSPLRNKRNIDIHGQVDMALL